MGREGDHIALHLSELRYKGFYSPTALAHYAVANGLPVVDIKKENATVLGFSKRFSVQLWIGIADRL